MRAGRLRHRLILQSKSESRDAYGAAIIRWSAQDTVWGAVEPLSGKEYFSQQAVQSESKVRIVIRYHSSITESWRVSHNGLYYDVLNVLNENTRDRMLILMCSEGMREDEDTVEQLYDVDGNPLNFVDGSVIEVVP